ncbi:hypothetical protein ACHAXR_008783 [Thalassiosira sp. AJA248-18]
MKTYCALGFGNNFFYPLGTESVPIPQNLLIEDEDDSDDSDNDDVNKSEGADDSDKCPGTQVSLLPMNPNASGQIISSTATEDHHAATASSASEWLESHLPSRSGDQNTKYSANIQPLVSCGATHTSFILPKQNSTSTPRSSVAAAGEAHLVGTIFGRTYENLTVQPTRLPLRIIRISSGRRHVLALTEGASPGGGVVMSWGAGHFGQLGHGPDLTSCLEPRIVERLLPHVVGGHVIEIAAGGLHSAAIVTSGSRNQKEFPSTNGDTKESIVVRETNTFAWGSNRKCQCGIDGGKCATVPEPLPVILVKRGETSKRDGDKTDLVDKNVHFEKLSLGRLHTVALTAYGEVFTWGSTSMGRCGHSSMDSGRGSDRRFVQQPRHVSALRNVSIDAISAGAAHTLALSKGGRVFAWGAGSDGQCGQGHAGNLFSPRAVQGLPTSSPELEKVSSKKKVPAKEESSKRKHRNEKGHMPHVNSKVAMEVSLEEEALSKALLMSQITNASASSPGPKSNKIVSIRASGCYSAAITAHGEVYTWGYGSGASGHPIPPQEDSPLPLIPIIEGNQYSTSTAAKVFPAGGSEDNKIRDCKCFDTDLNIMLPRKVKCTRTLGLRVEDVSLGPGHMVMLCSIRDSSDDNGVSNEARAGQSLYNADDGQESATDDSSHSNNEGEGKQSGAPGSAQGFGSPNDEYPGVTPNNESVPLGDSIGTSNTFESNDSSKSEKRRRSPGWMKKIKSSRTNKSFPGPESEKKKSLGKMLLRRGSAERGSVEK